jgi:precorrin-6B methylase 2
MTHPIRTAYDALPGTVHRAANTAIKRLGINAHLAVLFDSHLRQQGWFNSYDNEPTDKDGNPLPWMPYSFINFADDRLDSDFRVFEYGSGNSTRWLAERVGEVVAVEHEPEWYTFVKQRVPQNATVIQQDKRNYPQAISEFGEFDIVIIDGLRRNESIRASLAHLSPSGIVIVDDANREEYSDGYQLLEENGFQRIEFRGMGPYSSAAQTTAVYYREENCFEI